MPDYSKKIVYLTQAQYQELITNESITVNGVTVNYNENDIYVTPQAEPIVDVRVNGTSIAANGIVSIPLSSNNNLGLIQGAESRGITISNGSPSIRGATTAVVKEGTYGYLPIVASNQHMSVFYGLSKVAGVDLASETVTLGTYPATSKAAIQKMLGIDSLLAPNETDPFTSAHAIGDLFTMNGSLYRAKTAIAAADAVNVGTNCEVVGASEAFPHDIQVNGTSILSQGVANIPIANNNILGVVEVNPGGAYGIAFANNRIIRIANASSSEIKAGTEGYRPIVPGNQHSAVFYGLAKAAGDSTQSVSTNAVGTYTADAKAAIQKMLGITQTITVTVNTQDNVTVTNQTVTVREDDKNGPIFATATYSGQPVSFAVPNGFHYYISVSDTLAHHFNPTTASGIVANADVSVILTYSDFSSISSASDIKAALNADLDLTDLVGEQISCTWNNSTLVWDVVDYSNNTITLLTHDTLPTQLVFEPVQALMWCENGLAAGSYSFIDGSSTYYFTLTTAIPSGGQLRATTSAFQTYASMEATATLETGTVSTTEISGATSLGTTASGNLNHMSRVNYGSNNYKESALFQWLNSTEAANIPVPRITKFSRPCTYSVPGFLGALDSSFVAAIDDTTWLCSTNNTYECPTSLGGTVAKSNAYTVTAKVGLASEMEIFGSYGGTADGSAVFDLFNGATADDRKKYQPGTSTSRYWWLRSPYWSTAHNERLVNSSGTASNSSAYYSSGVVPAVKISKTVVSE